MGGWVLFNTRASCNKCHALTEEKQDVTYFTDNDFHNIGIGIIRHNVVAPACKAEQEINSGNAIDVDRHTPSLERMTFLQPSPSGFLPTAFTITALITERLEDLIPIPMSRE